MNKYSYSLDMAIIQGCKLRPQNCSEVKNGIGTCESIPAAPAINIRLANSSLL
jgi:hypothetical protein